MYAFETASLICGRTAALLTLTDAYVAVLHSKFADQLIKCLSVELPLGPLQHLKRVKPADKTNGQPLVEVLLCLKQSEAKHTGKHPSAAQPAASSDPEQEQSCQCQVALPTETAELLSSCSAQVMLQQVPITQPDTKEQWLEWCKVWPMPWRIPAGATEQDGDAPSPADQQYFEQHMAAALAASEAAGKRNVAIIVDAASGQVLAQQVDSREGHPLDHAAMRAIEQVAARDRQLWPFNGFTHTGRHAEAPDDQGYTTVAPTPHDYDSHVRLASIVDQGEHSRPGKKQKAESTTAVAAADADGLVEQATAAVATTLCGPASARSRVAVDQQPQTVGSSVEATTAVQAAALPPPNATEGTGIDWSKKPYLCTGYDCFLVHEPCYMCAMGLVHSRVARVIFCNLDSDHGVLGGRYRLQAEHTLNHHYQVYHMPLKQ
eukprot:GHUV01019435.1.p1 GENE.GHUV01019435.1~~GHUV01019435.1.p1  ORF type:complete len:433 (+),score=114.45 GHUV01019435.1:85-1383(+)